MTDVLPARRFAVALSYPSERRDFVASVANGLAAVFSSERVLYDRFHEAEFARPDLDVYLPELYRAEAELIVVFLCPEYSAKRWTRLEWRHVRQLIGTLHSERIMFVSFGDPGDTTSLGILPGDGYLDASGRTPTAIVDAITHRLRLRSAASASHPGLTARPPFQAPSLPASFVRREPITELIERVLHVDANGLGGGVAVTAIHGAPGVGKTTGASAIANHAAIRQRYTDGILWVTLGQGPDIAQQIGNLIRTFGDAGQTATNLAAAQGILRTELAGRCILLVLDDVWEAQHAVPFIAGDTSSHVVITTRRASVADDLGAVLYELGMMTEEDALSLLRARFRLGRRQVADDNELRAIAESAGNHPLAIELLAALLLRGYDAATAHRQLGGPRSRGARSRLTACIDLSLQWLYGHDQPLWQSFLWLGILRQNSPIPPPAAAALWDRPVSIASELLNELADDGLLQRGDGVFVLHDLLRNAALSVLRAPYPTGLGLTTDAAHATLLERYRRLCARGTWSTLSDDGYIHANLVHHMLEANMGDTIHELFAETSIRGAHGWFTARQELGQTPGFFEDLRIAAQSVTRHDPARVARHLRYALIQSSVDSALDRAPAAMPAVLLERGVWSAFRAIHSALRINERNRGEAVGLVTNTLALQGRSDSPELALASSEMRKVAESHTVPAVCCVVLAIGAAPEDRAFYVARAAESETDPARLLWLSQLLDGPARDMLHDRACELTEKWSDPVRRVSQVGTVLCQASAPVRVRWLARVAEWLNGSVPERKRALPPAESPATDSATLFLAPSALGKPNPGSARRDEPKVGGRRWLRPILEEIFRWPFDFDVALFRKSLARLTTAERHNLLQARPAANFLPAPTSVLTPAEAIQASFDRISTLLNDNALYDACELLPYCTPRARQELADLASRKLTEFHDQSQVREAGIYLELLLPYNSEAVRTSILEKFDARLFGERLVATVRRYRAAEGGQIGDVLENLSEWWDLRGTSLSSLMLVMPPAGAEQIGSVVAIGDAPERTAAVVALSAYGSMASVSAALGEQIPSMIALVNALSHALGAGTVSDVVHAAARWHSEWWIVEALTLTTWKVATASELDTIAQAQDRLCAPDLRARLIERVCQRMCELGLFEHISLMIHRVSLPAERWRIAAELAPSIAERGATELALQLADEIPDAVYASKARAGIALAMAYSGAVSKARALSIGDDDWRDWRDRLLHQASDHGGPAVRASRRPRDTQSAREHELAAIIAGVREAGTNSPNVSGLAPICQAAEEQDEEALNRAIEALWTSDAGGLSYVQRLALMPRPALMRVIRDLAPIIAYGRSTNADEVIDVIGSVGRWWP